MVRLTLQQLEPLKPAAALYGLDTVSWYGVYSSGGAAIIQAMTISAAARQSGVGVETIRFYERKGLLALFLAQSPGANATRALSSALGIRKAAAALNASRRRAHDPIVVNIGINAGAALIGTTRLRGRTGEFRQFAANGPVTNVAARLCALADHGQILATGAVARMLRQAFEFRRLGRRRLKNVSAPVEVFEIAPGVSPRRARGPY